MFETTIIENGNEVETEEIEIRVCYECSRVINEGEETECDENLYCERCYNRYFFTCYHCNSVFDDREEHENMIDGNSYCDDCFQDLFVFCENCDEIMERDDSFYDEYSERTLCQSCYDDLFSACSSCDNICRTNELEYVRGIGDICENCMGELSVCDDCGGCVSENASYSDADSGNIYCYSCNHERSVIRNHSYKPYPRFQGKALDNYFSGFELEIDRSGDNKNENGKSETAQKIQENFSYLYCKEDSSLNHGFEIVSHPFSWKWFQENKNDFKDLLETITKNNWESYTPGTCGMHVHVSKKAFTSFHLFKFLKFFYNNRNFPFIKKISQRGKVTGYWGREPETASNDEMIYSAKNKGGIKRYRNTAVNLIPSYTVEIRIFRGTTNLISFLKNLEFVRSVFQFTKEYPPSKINLSSYVEYILENRKEYPNLTSFMLAKGLFSLAINS